MDVIYKEGMLYLQAVKFGKRTWRKIWMMLFKPSTSGVGRLEMYSVRDACNKDAMSHQKKPPQLKRAGKRVVRLCDCLSITLAPEESCPPGCRALYLSTTLCTYTLASKTCQDWLHALCHLTFQRDPGQLDQSTLDGGEGLSMEDNDLYSSWKTEPSLPPEQYHVTVQATEASRRCKLDGEYLFSPDREAMLLMDVHTGHTIYHWPYRFLRRFGEVKGGFSIEAGQRCDSGQGKFTFLSKRGPQIYQAIAKQCLVEDKTKDSSAQSPNVYIGSLSDHSPDRANVQLPTTTSWPPDPPISNPSDAPADTAVEPDSVLYASINHSPALDRRQSFLCGLQRPLSTYSLETEGEEGENNDEERCRSLEDNVGGDSIYYNLRGWMSTRMKDQTQPETDLSQSIYSAVNIPETPSQLQPRPLFLPPSQAFPQLQSLPYLVPKPRYQPQLQSLVKNQIQPWYQPQDQAEGAEEVMEVMGVEEAQSCSPSVTPTEIPVSFKQKLSEIISKDLAKFQPSPPSGGGSSPSSHY